MMKTSVKCWWLVASAWLVAAGPANAQSSFARGTHLEWPGVLTGAFLGFLLLPVAYNIAFFMILRERFLIWQGVRVLALVALTICLSSLPLGPWLPAESFERQILINILFDAAIAIIGPFLRSLLEPGMLGPRTYRLLGWQPWFVALTTPAMLLHPCPPLYMLFRNAVLIGALVLLCIALIQAIGRGSRTARFQAAAWSCVMMVCGISLYHDVVLGRPFGLFLYALFAALALEMLLTSIGIGDRFMRMKVDHDSARAHADSLEIMAYTDPLTGLGNRRSLEDAFALRRPNAVAIVDIDHFKQINDWFGHDQGDRVIVAVASALQGEGVFAARIGGEEFALLLYDDRPVEQAERLRQQATRRVAEAVRGLDRPVTASTGVAFLSDDTSFAAVMKAADRHLYIAKNEGRNRTIGPDTGHATSILTAPSQAA
ncbi:MAG: GGDEF domain-containing protein [bacterium]|nr:GGDEF domain-containing protein [bacterium]